MKEHPIDSGVESLLVIQATICHYIKKNLSEAKFGTRLKSWDGNMKSDNLQYNTLVCSASGPILKDLLALKVE